MASDAGDLSARAAAARRPVSSCAKPMQKVQPESSYQCFELERQSSGPSVPHACPERRTGGPEERNEVAKLRRRLHGETGSSAATGRSAQTVCSKRHPDPSCLPRPSAALSQPSHRRRVNLQPRPFHCPAFKLKRAFPTRERWLWAIPIVAGAWDRRFHAVSAARSVANASIALRASNEAQTVQLAWDANSRAIRDSDRAEIEIDDGGKTRRFRLPAINCTRAKCRICRNRATLVSP